MVVGWIFLSCRRGFFRRGCRFEHCHPFKKPANYQERRKYRQEIWSAWLNSVSDDLDLFTDWLFFFQMYDLYGADMNGGMEARATLALFVFSILGTVSYLLELYQLVFKYPNTFGWLSLFTILGEDVPQILLTLVLSGKFDNPTPLAMFNIATSIYSAMIKISGELFLNYCYCCKILSNDDEDEDEYEDIEARRR